MTETLNDIPPPQHTEQFLRNKDIVIVSLAEWNGPKRIRQYLTEELLRRGNRILFVEAYYTLSKFIKRPSLARFLQFAKGPREILPNLFQLHTFPFIPAAEFSRALSRLNWTYESLFIKGAIRRLGFRDVILWIFAYNASPLLGKFDEALSIYFCNDAFSQLAPTVALQHRISELESELLNTVELVFTVSDKLSEEKSRHHRSVHTIYHGVDYGLFERSLAPGNFKRPTDVPSGKPVIGYSGVIRYMIDLDLLDFLSESRPDWSLVLVGPITESSSQFYRQVDQLRQRSNIHFLGPRRPEELPQYIHSFDVCLLPYIKAEVSTYYSAPLKFYEYLAAGKPVVSTVGPRQYDERVVINAFNQHEVQTAIARALQMNQPEDLARRKAIARENRWSHRVDAIDAIVRKHISRNRTQNVTP